MRTVLALIVINTMLLSSSPSMADDDSIAFAKSLTAKEYDQNSPPLLIEQWLTSVLPRGIVALWEKYVTDCGEQTGVQAMDKERDMPMCAEIELKENNRSVGYILLSVGTERKGKSRTDAGLYYGEISRNGFNVRLRKLSDLKNIR